MDENYDVPYFALYADIDQLESLQNHETGLGVFSTCAVFVSRHIEDVLVRLRVEWPASVDARRAIKRFGKKTRQLQVLVPIAAGVEDEFGGGGEGGFEGGGEGGCEGGGEGEGEVFSGAMPTSGHKSSTG